MKLKADLGLKERTFPEVSIVNWLICNGLFQNVLERYWESKFD
jgi:hypothetical protein